MRKSFTLYSSLWATVLMFVLFIFSSVTGSRTPISGSNMVSRGFPYVKGKVIVLDPGHGGGDPGTVGVGATTEAENVLAIAWELKTMLEKAGANVIMTRQSDRNPAQGTSFSGQQNGQLAARVATANRSSGQIFISLHNDWNDNRNIQGTSVHFYKSQDLALAEALQNSLVRQINSVDLGIMRSNFYVLRNTNMPAALVEIGFLSNPSEAALLAQHTYRLAVARGLLAGINEYFKAVQ
ncbi:MAG: N-acetylmuramoyl-L-alanine amidase [Firmicutes bacterium]|nr:N-acetylmuramoyl-L-alanine amidase [Bacillota bacterium]